MDGQRFDAVTRAAGTSRRRALRLLGGGLAGGALAAVGARRTAVRAQDESTSPECRQCISDFFGQCVSTCVRTFPGQETCALACCEGSLSTCTVLGQCTPTATATCPPPPA